MDGLYGKLADLTAESLFGVDKAGMPVYTLADQNLLDGLAQDVAATEGSHGSTPFTALVRRSLFLDSAGVAPLKWHRTQSKNHARDPLEPPPSLPLLVVLTIAAERMQADGGMASNNFYGRLFPLLDIPLDRQSAFINDYRASAELMWGTLNAWLESWEGERGVPTAYSMGGMRMVGLPISQAVVRQYDRAGLQDCFAAEGLPPGLQMGAADMETALAPYVASLPSPLSRNIVRLWAQPAARERIVQAACLELESWSGDPRRRADGTRTTGTVRVMAYLRSFPQKVIEFNLAFPVLSSEDPVLKVETDAGDTEVATTRGPVGTVRLAVVQDFSAESLITNEIVGRVGNEESPVGRQPRRLFPLRWDELQGCFVETERVALGEDHLVVVKSNGAARTRAFLDEHARVGWQLHEDMPGMPAGWQVFERVQLLSAPTGSHHVELLPLVPRSRTSLTLRGGFALPGRLRKWSSLDPPEVVAVAQDASTVSVLVYPGSRVETDAEVARVEVEGPLAVVDIAEAGLTDGEYVVAMFVNAGKRPVSSVTLRLRSADTPLTDVSNAAPVLAYNPAQAEPPWPLSAGPHERDQFIRGALTAGLVTDDAPPPPMPDFRPREKRAPRQPLSRRRLGRALPDSSCMASGKHRFDLPTAHAGRPLSRTIEGECTTCGLVKRFAATAGAAKRRRPAEGLEAPGFRLVVPPVEDDEDTKQHIAFDALSHVGTGSFGVFERIAGQIEGSGLFADTFIRRQEVLGHVDVRRDDTLQAQEWAVTAPTLVPVSDGSRVLVGFRSRSLVESLRRVLGEEGHVQGDMDGGLLRLTVWASEEALEIRRREMADLGVVVLDESPARRIATSLPPLSQVEAALRRVPVPATRSCEVWDTRFGTWVRATSVATTGAFRFTDFRRVYAVRSRADLDAGTVGLASAQLAKHVANAWVGDPLFGYHQRTKSVVVPLGAELPVLYGRALSLCSGRSPRELPSSRIVQYPDVQRAVADVVADRLAG